MSNLRPERREVFCGHVWGDTHRRELMIGMTDGRAGMVSLEGTPLGPTIDEPVSTSDTIALLPLDDIVIVGRYDNKTVSAHNWRTGERLWHLDGYEQLQQICCHSKRKAVVHHGTGCCSELDALNGKVLGECDGVMSVLADSMTPRIMLVRGGLRPRTAMTLECRRRLCEVPTFEIPCDVAGYPRGTFADSWVALSENEFGRILCLANDGTELWRYVPEPEQGFPCITKTPDGRHVFGDRRPFKRSRPFDEAWLFDAQSGEVVWRKDLPIEHLAYEPIAEGSIIAGPKGLLHIPELTWEARDFRLD